MARRAARFLALLMTSSLETDALQRPFGTAPFASFGLAAVSWPGQALVNALSARWARNVLTRLTAPVTGAEERAHAAARWLVSAKRLAPPFLIEKLSALIPPMPGHLVDDVPDPPWPWQLADAKARLEAKAQRWEDEWHAVRTTSEHTCSEVHADWHNTVQIWLDQQVTQTIEGALQNARAHIEAIASALAT